MTQPEDGSADNQPTLAELERVHSALSIEERLNMLEEMLVACSRGWPVVLGLLNSYVLDHETRETSRMLPEVPRDEGPR